MVKIIFKNLSQSAPPPGICLMNVVSPISLMRAQSYDLTSSISTAAKLFVHKY